MTNRHKTQSLALLRSGRKTGSRVLFRTDETRVREQHVTSKAIGKGALEAI